MGIYEYLRPTMITSLAYITESAQAVRSFVWLILVSVFILVNHLQHPTPFQDEFSNAISLWTV